MPGIRLDQGDDELQRNALAGSAPADNADRLPRRDGQVNVLGLGAQASDVFEPFRAAWIPATRSTAHPASCTLLKLPFES